LGCFALPLAVVGFVFVALSTTWGSRWSVDQGAEIYSDLIPGELRVNGFEGTILQGCRFEGVTLSDRRRRPLVTAKKVTLQLHTSKLLRGEISVHRHLPRRPSLRPNPMQTARLPCCPSCFARIR
jgi:autotransporter translocation and assembly factor TamB